MAETIYVLTFYELNHGLPDYRGEPLNPRFLETDRNYVWFLIDEEVPKPLEGRKIVFETDFDPRLARAGAKHLAEWSFLLMEVEHAFCEYPFFMVSSRFYEKNIKLGGDLNTEWDKIFSYLRRYGWGYLPSYNRRLRWLDYAFEKQAAWGHKEKFSPFNQRSFDVVEDLFGVNIPREYTAWTDLQCNYIGFNSREHLLEYVEYYRPFFDYFFDEDWELKRDVAPFVKPALEYRNEKPLTYLLEFISHLFFFARGHPFFALHYQGYYEIEERRKKMRLLERGFWFRRPRWLADWLFSTRVVQPIWPYLSEEMQLRLGRSKAGALGWWGRRSARRRARLG